MRRKKEKTQRQSLLLPLYLTLIMYDKNLTDFGIITSRRTHCALEARDRRFQSILPCLIILKHVFPHYVRLASLVHSARRNITGFRF